MMAKAGERMPVACTPLPPFHLVSLTKPPLRADRYKKVIYDTLLQLCGEQFVEPLPATSYHRPGYVAPSESVYADPAPSMASLFNNLLTCDGAGIRVPSASIGPVLPGSCVF